MHRHLSGVQAQRRHRVDEVGGGGVGLHHRRMLSGGGGHGGIGGDGRGRRQRHLETVRRTVVARRVLERLLDQARYLVTVDLEKKTIYNHCRRRYRK